MIKTIRGFMKRLNEDHVGAYAAQSAYFILLSFIPFVLLVVTLVKYTPLTRDDVYSVLINMLPTEFQSYVGGIVNEIFYQSVAYMPITIITTLWSAGKGIAALTNGLNSIYHVTETRNYIINRCCNVHQTSVPTCISSILLCVPDICSNAKFEIFLNLKELAADDSLSLAEKIFL
jgi:membrane protein